MVIEKVHGLQATAMTLNDRFTILAKAAPVAARPRRRASGGSLFNYNNRNLIEQIARRLEQQAKRQAVRQRLGFPGGNLRRFGSESSLPGLRRSNSFGNLSQQSVKNRVSWRQSNNNLNRSGSVGNMGTALARGRLGRGFRRRGGGARAVRGRFGGGRQNTGRVTRVQQRNRRGVTRNNGDGHTALRPNPARGRGRGGAGRGGSKLMLSKEELDAQLDQYMAGTKAALDRELDNYMKNAMELE